MTSVTTPPAISGVLTRNAAHPPPRSTTRPDPGNPPQEVTPMLALTELLDHQAFEADADIPCQTNDAELWFEQTPAGVEFAKALCGTCPVRSACLAGALDRREPWGVWGGELFEAGVVLARKRPRGRPRKDSLAA